MRISQGFTLIELVIAIAIVSIISAIAFPAYERYKLKGYRMDAISNLTTKAVLQENWLAENGRYTNDIDEIGGATSKEDHYSIALTVPVDGSTFSITATTKNSQVNDNDDCKTFTVDNIGRKTAKDKNNIDTSKKCWSR